jgi:hypothetical protein
MAPWQNATLGEWRPVHPLGEQAKRCSLSDYGPFHGNNNKDLQPVFVAIFLFLAYIRASLGDLLRFLQVESE